ncbi:MAG: ABC transporter ATP-binding protein [Chloroflexi bacterium]|nr:ABC transporter ATP-binding protein [Chloroflexota bacterium]
MTPSAAALPVRDSRLTAPVLRVDHVDTYYGPIKTLKDVSLEIFSGEMVCLLGGNASGKSTTMKAVMGSVRPARGTIEFEGQRIDRWNTAQRVRTGISLVPEARRIFSRLTVRENLEMGAFTRNDPAGVSEDLDRIFSLFPRLHERLNQKGGTLSGGEQQMLAMGRALMTRPKLLCMDEPSMGLAPALVETVFETIHDINRQGTTIFVVEQNASVALSYATRGYVIRTGEIVLQDSAANLLANDDVRKAYLGE